MLIVYSSRFRDDSIAKQYSSVNMVAKRPGVEYFLAYMSQFYEIVIFTTQPSYVRQPMPPLHFLKFWRFALDCRSHTRTSIIRTLCIAFIAKPRVLSMAK